MISRRELLTAATTMFVPNVLTAQHNHKSNDVVINHIGKEFARLYKSTRNRVPTRDNANALIANTHLMIEYKGNDIDRVLQSLDRTTMLNARPDHHQHAKELKELFDMDISDEIPRYINNEDRNKHINKIITNGGAEVWDNLSKSLEANIHNLASNTYYSPNDIKRLVACNQHDRDSLIAAQMVMDIFCAASIIAPEFGPLCVIQVGAYWAYYWFLYWSC